MREMMFFLVALVFVGFISWCIGVVFGYGAARVNAGGLRQAEGSLNDIRRWALQNGDVFPEASIAINDMVADYYESKEI